LKTLIEQTRMYIFILTVTGGCLCVLVALFLFFSVNQPLRAIEHAIQKIMTGDYTTISLDFKSKEFYSLTTSMNAMINELNRRSEQLIQSKKMASLGTLTSGVAHELNNPLNNISTSIQILIEELEDDNLDFKRELLVETETQVERARDIIKALLEFSRKTDHKPMPVQLKELVAKTLRLIKGEVPANVEVAVDLPEGMEAVIDPQRVQQVLINLILNGVQAMEDGGMLTILAENRPGAKEICIRIKDTGKGIAKEELPKIFDPFYTLKDVGKGSGLGLSVSLGIIEQHGGRIEVKSELGKGTVFSVFLPAEKN
jgi:two-component system, NtrC family, sensor kinase